MLSIICYLSTQWLQFRVSSWMVNLECKIICHVNEWFWLVEWYYITILIFSSGAYVPLTKDGNLVVGGVLASCYASFDHDLAHFAMIPMQWYPEMTQWIFGVDNGTPDYLNIAKVFGRLVLPSELLYGKSG